MIGQLSQGGSERQLYLFLAHCDRARWAPVVYVSGELGFWEPRIRALGIPVVLLRGGRIAKMRQLRAACAAQGATCFFSWSSYTNPFGLALWGRNVHRIGSFRNALFADLPGQFRGIWAGASLAGISVGVCNSKETYAELARHGGRWRVRPAYVPNGVEAPGPAQIAAWRAAWRAHLGLRDGEVLVAGVGRLAPQKRFDRFVEVVAKIAAGTSVRAVVAGADYGCRDDLERFVARLGLEGAVRFLGAVPDARELICAADIFLLSSDHEGMPNVVIEAMAAGVPCVVTRVNAVADLIDHGETGFIAERDAAGLAQHVARLAKDPVLRGRLGARARAVIAREQEAAVIARRLWTLCEGHSDRRDL